ncbi:MAG: hypothetical protein AB7P35_17550 [Hyphomonadaceae bacterium]
MTDATHDRDEIARILEIVARDGLPQPRDLDAAADADSHPPPLDAAPRPAGRVRRMSAPHEDTLALEAATRAACAAQIEAIRDASEAQLRLLAGEMTAQELRTVRAFLGLAARTVRGAPAPAGRPGDRVSR